ncbi:glycosyl hydrolase family 31 [Bacteroidia bacterium]|nr:glycosyl hydrolase family 31 [Bacteroidia bacterium]
MKIKNIILSIISIFSFCLSSQAQKIEKVHPGIWKVTYGQPEKHLPTDFKEPASESLSGLPDRETAPFDLRSIQFKEVPKGIVAELKIGKSEKIYGFGLQVNSLEQRGMRREIRSNSWTVGNVGFGHAPMPFYISSEGYGVLVNTARYVTFYMGSQNKLAKSAGLKKELPPEQPGTTLAELYNSSYTPSEEVEIVVEGTKGMEIYVFDGPSMMEVIQRYNLFSGGGYIPPLWGLGLKYRAKSTFNDKEVLKFAQYFREKHIPCDMFGLEPGWHSAAYSCSYAWNPKNFPEPDRVIDSMHGMNYKLNLWEHAYVHPTSPIFEQILPYSGDYAVWKGAVPDFITPQAKEIFGSYHKTNFLEKGISSFKLDECDAADYKQAEAEWSFPDIASFPSGIDGVQYRQLLGLLYQKMMVNLYHDANLRTLLEVRASHLFAAPYSAILYSDMYEHVDYIRMILNAGFSGISWSPEVRQTGSEDDLIRRLQSSLMSSHMVVDCWFLNNPPWFHYDRNKNNKNEVLPNYLELEQTVKKLIELRMKLIPYLYTAFARYHFEGVPPFRSLVLDYPEDREVWKLATQYMMGDQLMCAPFIDGVSEREVYFPKGVWYDFNTKKKYEGGQKYTIRMTLDEIPVFVKDGTILPLAEPVEYITPETVLNVTCQVYGTPEKPARLYEDDGKTFDFEKGDYNWIELSWNKNKGKVVRNGKNKKQLYKIVGWTSCTPRQESIESLIKDRLDRSLQQYELMAASLMDQPDRLPGFDGGFGPVND